MCGSYFRNPAMFEGGPFVCYNCLKLLVGEVKGNNYELELRCPRCKAEITVKVKEKIPFTGKVRQDRKKPEAPNTQVTVTGAV